MAADRYYAGGNDWNQVPTWKTSTGGGSAVPVSTDSILFADRSDVIDTGLNQSAVDTAKIRWMPGTKVRIGAAGTPLEISCTGEVRYQAVEGFVYFKCGSTNVATIVVDSAGIAQFYIVGGTIDTSIDISSFCRINDQTSLSAVTIRTSGLADVIIQYKSDATDPTVFASGGTLRIERPMTALTNNGAHVIVAVEKEATAAANVTHNDGITEWLRGDVSGTFDASAGKGTVDFSNVLAPPTFNASKFGPDVEVKGHPDVNLGTTTLVGSRPAAYGPPAT